MSMKQRAAVAALAVLSLAASVPVLAAAPAAAPKPTAAPKQLGEFHGWTAYEMTDGKSEICYVVGAPKAQEPAKTKRDAHLLITHRPSDKAFNVVSVEPGPNFAFAKGADVTVAVDKQSFAFFTASDTAWSRDSDTDKAVVTAMSKGKELTVKAKPAKGADVSDTYALVGFGDALGAIDKACKVKR
jgi:invasion protein IalB